MASARVRFEDYVEGTLPDVSVLSGRPTRHRVTMTDEVVPDKYGSGRIVPFLLHRLEVVIHPGAPLLVLKGRVPMEVEEEARLERQRTLSRAGFWVGLGVLIAAAWWGAALSPAIALVAVVGIGAALYGGWVTRRAWPRAYVDDALPETVVEGVDRGTWVTIEGVHDDFASEAGL